MTNEDKGDFEDLMVETWAIYGQKPPSTDTIKGWWKLLNAYELKEVRQCMTEMVKTKDRISLSAVFEGIRKNDELRKIMKACV